MPRKTRDTLLMAKVETTPGTPVTLAAATDALLVSDFTINTLNANNVDRALIRPYIGGAEQLVGTAYKEVSFTVELASSGAAGTAPPWGKLLRGCAFAETVSAGQRVEYTPITNSLEALTISCHDSGVKHLLAGARGTVRLMAMVGDRPKLEFRFVGLDAGDTAESNPSPTLTMWQVPEVVTDANTGDVTLGCTYATGSLSGGTAYPSTGLELDLGLDVKHIPLLGAEYVDITDRDVNGKMMLDLTAAQEVTFQTNVKANTLQSVGMQHGTGAGKQVVIYAPQVQLINPRKEEKDGIRLIGYDLRVVPNSGNDELRIVAK